jgi:DNA replication protein DnaC
MARSADRRRLNLTRSSKVALSSSDEFDRIIARIKGRMADPAYVERALHQRAMEDALAERHRREEDKERREECCIPPRIVEMLHRVEDTEATEIAYRFMKNTKKFFLFLSGGEGVGKTVAAALMIERAGRGLFIHATDLVTKKFARDEWEKVKGTHLLVIDDLGTEADVKGYFQEAFYEVLNTRYDAMLKTILTCNMTGDTFKKSYCQNDGGRLLGRIREVGLYEEISGESMRKATG